MTASRRLPVALGLRAIRGGSVVVGVAVETGVPRVVLSGFLATAAEGDTLANGPYLVAAGMTSQAQAVAAITEGRKRQDQMAATELGKIVARLNDEHYEPAIAALLINRAGWVTDLLAYSRAAPEHPPVAEGLAVRDALRFALQDRSMAFIEIDEKSLPNLASAMLPATHIENALKTLGVGAGKPWRKKQKLACLAAWVTLLQI